MSCDILYRSYAQDFNWLGYSLKSLKKRASGFHRVHIAVPASDFGMLPVCDGEVHLVQDPCRGYMAQQITKLYADHFCHADYVLHVDSDCIFSSPVKPEDFFVNGKPVLLREEGCESPWMDISARSLGWRDDAEYMRRMPIIYPRWIYSEFRDWMKERNGMPIEQWIDQQPNSEFSEFNTLGQWAYKFHRDAFEWLHPSEMKSFCKQHWSWGGLTDEIRQEIEQCLALDD